MDCATHFLLALEIGATPVLHHRVYHYPIPRANPFPKVTDLLCRLPLPTFTHRLEAINLGDLLRNSGTKQSINERLVWRFAEQRMLIRQLD